MARKKPAPPKPRRWNISSRDAGLGALLLAVLLFVYLPAMQGGRLWDDDVHLTSPALQSLDGLERIWFRVGATPQYYPVLHSAFWIEHRLWGDALVGYHLTNVFLHALAAFLLVAILRRLSVPGAWLAAFVFALHPVYVESVAWISEQKNTLSIVFYLASALVYLSFDQTRKRSHYALSLALFVLAMASKTVTATLPACLLVILWWKRGRLDFRKDVLPLAPWLVLGLAGGVFSAWMERANVGAQGAHFDLSLLQRCMLAGRVIWFYIAKLAWPASLMFIYPHWTIDPHVWWQYSFTLGAVALGAALVMLARQTRAPLAGYLFFVGTLVPVLGFLNVYPFQFSYVADHFQYIASLGIIVPAAAGLTLLSRRFFKEPAWRAMLAAACLTGLALLSWNRAGVYQNAEMLYTDTVEQNPGSWMAHNNLAGVLMNMPGRQSEAIAQLDAVVRLNPDAAQPHVNLGLLYSGMRGRQEQAIGEFRKAIQLDPANAEAHNDLGTTLSDIPGRREDAIAEYKAALRINPDYAEAHNNLGSALSEDQARMPEAIDEFRAAVRANPALAEAQANLGVALAKDPTQLAEAVQHLTAALQLRPDMQPVRQLLAQISAAR